jgi:4-carboxymuconolactone decarboxylase
MVAKKKITTKTTGKKTVGKKMPPPRLAVMAEEALTPEQAALLNSIRSGPRGGSVGIRGPFAVLLHAPAFGELAQQLGGHCRFNTAVPPRLSEFAVLATAKLWRAQYEWFAHVPQAERAGVSKQTIRDLHRGRVPKSAPKDERAIYDFIQ